MFMFTYIFCCSPPVLLRVLFRLFVCHRWLTGLRNLLGGWVSVVSSVLVIDSYVCLWLYSVINSNSGFCSPCFCSGIRFPSLWVVWITRKTTETHPPSKLRNPVNHLWHTNSREQNTQENGRVTAKDVSKQKHYIFLKKILKILTDSWLPYFILQLLTTEGT